jgi:ComF family protein
MQELKALAKSFINLLYPLRCLGCSKQLDALNELNLCDQCIAAIKKNAMPPFELDTPSVMVYSACIYEGVFKELIHGFKYNGKLALAKIFVTLLESCIKENPEMLEADVVTAVPLHRSRMRQREFNQSSVLANKLAGIYGLPVKNVLKKIKKTKYQNELTKSERLVNLKNAFKVCNPAAIEGKRILLIDDVMTTGATLGECAGALLASGAKKVTCLTLARGIQ